MDAYGLGSKKRVVVDHEDHRSCCSSEPPVTCGTWAGIGLRFDKKFAEAELPALDCHERVIGGSVVDHHDLQAARTNILAIQVLETVNNRVTPVVCGNDYRTGEAHDSYIGS